MCYLEHLSIICSGWAGLRCCGATSGCIQEASGTVCFCWPRRGRAYLAQGAGLGESRLAGTNGDQALGIRFPHAPSPGGAAVGRSNTCCGFVINGVFVGEATAAPPGLAFDLPLFPGLSRLSGSARTEKAEPDRPLRSGRRPGLNTLAPAGPASLQCSSLPTVMAATDDRSQFHVPGLCRSAGSVFSVVKCPGRPFRRQPTNAARQAGWHVSSEDWTPDSGGSI